MVKRTEKITFRMTPGEKAHLRKQAANSGLNTESFIRSAIAGQKITPKTPEQWTEILRELAAIGNNLNQIARVANATGVADICGIAEIREKITNLGWWVKFGKERHGGENEAGKRNGA
jgi:hypothetical protein